jgi:diaminopimelate decarboxylase
VRVITDWTRFEEKGMGFGSEEGAAVNVAKYIRNQGIHNIPILVYSVGDNPDSHTFVERFAPAGYTERFDVVEGYIRELAREEVVFDKYWLLDWRGVNVGGGFGVNYRRCRNAQRYLDERSS